MQSYHNTRGIIRVYRSYAILPVCFVADKASLFNDGPGRYCRPPFSQDCSTNVAAIQIYAMVSREQLVYRTFGL